jgi:aquaporin Z
MPVHGDSVAADEGAVERGNKNNEKDETNEMKQPDVTEFLAFFIFPNSFLSLLAIHAAPFRIHDSPCWKWGGWLYAGRWQKIVLTDSAPGLLLHLALSNHNKDQDMKSYVAEFLGTFWLVLCGCGSAMLAALFFPGGEIGTVSIGIGLLGVAFAFGLAVLTMAFAIGHISGCHLNPAVSIGLWVGGRFPSAQLLPYIGSQVAGGVAGAVVLNLIASGGPAFSTAAGFASVSNGYGIHSPGGFSLMAGLVTEVVVTMMFLIVILGATDKRAPQGFAPIAIGLALTTFLLLSIPVTNASLNPARSTATAVLAGGWALAQLWLFWVAPILGGALGGVIYKFLADDRK